MRGMLATTWAELAQLQTIWSVTTILRRDVVTFLALSACQRNARTDVGALACHFVHLNNSYTCQSLTGRCSEEETRTLDLTIMSRTL